MLLDLRLGLELGGEDILYQIRTNPRLEHTRVVVITGYPSLAEPIANLTDLTLIKPVDINQLRTLVQRVSSSEKKPKTEYFRDPLTGLFHQEFFQTRLEHAFERRKRLPEFLYGVVVFSLNFNPPLEEETPDELRQIMEIDWGASVEEFSPRRIRSPEIATYKFASLHEDLKKPEDIQ